MATAGVAASATATAVTAIARRGLSLKILIAVIPSSTRIEGADWPRL
jgi:hypothetical protein